MSGALKIIVICSINALVARSDIISSILSKKTVSRKNENFDNIIICELTFICNLNNSKKNWKSGSRNSRQRLKMNLHRYRRSMINVHFNTHHKSRESAQNSNEKEKDYRDYHDNEKWISSSYRLFTTYIDFNHDSHNKIQDWKHHDRKRKRVRDFYKYRKENIERYKRKIKYVISFISSIHDIYRCW